VTEAGPSVREDVVMKSEAPDVASYIDEAPAERREFLGALRDVCQDELVGFEEDMTYGMPSYKRAGEVEVAFASQARHVALYILRKDVLDVHRERLSPLNVGKGCIRYTRPEKADMGVIRSLLKGTASSSGPIC
jgi:uncharacterized protein YdhG (YjbR/CyaY superfamily)